MCVGHLKTIIWPWLYRGCIKCTVRCQAVKMMMRISLQCNFSLHYSTACVTGSECCICLLKDTPKCCIFHTHLTLEYTSTKNFRDHRKNMGSYQGTLLLVIQSVVKHATSKTRCHACSIP